ncbi:MAG: hypothetical protein II740_08455 [Lachnospiraceae bacterium]|nr:hypothetical protein [Lachnospiraceae bacterium]
MIKRKLSKWLLGIGAIALLVSSGCGKAVSSTPASLEKEPESTVEASVDTENKEDNEIPEVTLDSTYESKKGEVIVYFANWNLDEKEAMYGGEVAGIPWESVTYVNHAFWEVYPEGEDTESSFERREKGLPARTSFKIAPTSEEPDLLDDKESKVVAGLKRNHFSEYEYFSDLYPDVNIMISVGGWSDSGFFSEMAYTEEGRKSFADSCVNLIKEYPWIDGIDIDWEYPAGSNDGERYPEGEGDEGCPIFGTQAEDRENYALMLKCLRDALTKEFGEGEKKITACASASTGWTLPNQDWALAEPYLDLINIMTYDLAGTWDGSAGLASSGNGAKSAVLYLKVKGIPTSKLCIGSPMYATVWKIKEDANININGQTEDEAPNDSEIDSQTLEDFEKEAVSGYEKVFEGGLYKKGEEFDKGGKGWHFKYHKIQDGVYMFNDDESSPYYRWYISYENEVSLCKKIELINQYDLAGIIVWETSEDTHDHKLVKLMGSYLK